MLTPALLALLLTTAPAVPLVPDTKGKPPKAEGLALPAVEGGKGLDVHLVADPRGLWLRADVEDASVTAQDTLLVSLAFPSAGAAGGHTFRFGPDGRKSSRPEDLTSDFAQGQVKATVTKREGGLRFELR